MRGLVLAIGLSLLSPPPLAARRATAVGRGLGFLERALADPASRAALGWDAVSIFLELGETSRDPTVRRRALADARGQARDLGARLLSPHGLDDRDDLLDALALLPDARLLGLGVEPLLSRTGARLRALPSADALYGVDVSRLDRLDEDDLFALLLESYKRERADVAFPGLLRPGLGLEGVLRFVLARRLTGRDEDVSTGHAVFHDHAYLATHVGFVLGDYGRLRVRSEDLGPLLPWLRAQLDPVLRAGDVELVAEIVDVLRALGHGDEDEDVRRGSERILSRQRPDGGRGDPEEPDVYDAVHPTWTALGALRDRTFLAGTPFESRLRRLSARLPGDAQARAPKQADAVSTAPGRR